MSSVTVVVFLQRLSSANGFVRATSCTWISRMAEHEAGRRRPEIHQGFFRVEEEGHKYRTEVRIVMECKRGLFSACQVNIPGRAADEYLRPVMTDLQLQKIATPPFPECNQLL